MKGNREPTRFPTDIRCSIAPRSCPFIKLSPKPILSLLAHGDGDVDAEVTIVGKELRDRGVKDETV